MEKQNENKKIKFKPLHEGMGFHPFSDGLPYAPSSKATEISNRYSSGAGATSAGSPRFVNPNSIQQNRPLGTARQLQQQAQQQNPVRAKTNPDLAQLQKQIQKLSTVNKSPALQKTSAVTAAPIEEPALHAEAGILRKRFFAYLMDTVIHSGFWLATNLTALFFFKFQIDSEILKNNFFQFLIFFAVSQWMFIGLQEMLFGNSLGKVFFNLEFKRNHRSLLLRSMVFMLGALCLGLGFYFRPQDKLGLIQTKASSA